ncbi:MAG: ATP-binding protein [Saprospiraceae bacterium]|nr:ATP-binding protein [Saprospiraceae bacterium]
MSRFFVLTGPESSGKTRLANALAAKMNLPLVDEYARIYFSTGPRQYTEIDIDHIAYRQEQLEKEITQPTIICDTDLLTCLIWKKVVFEVWDEKMATKIASYTDRHYLLCTPEITWEADPLREKPQR